jgi:serine/threonine protein kinase
MGCFIVTLSRNIFYLLRSENILLKDSRIKLTDFGSCQDIVKNPDKEYTEYVSTRWYRSPECLMTKGVYNYKVLQPTHPRWTYGAWGAFSTKC